MTPGHVFLPHRQKLGRTTPYRGELKFQNTPGSNETFSGFAAAADTVDLDEAIDLDGVMPTAGIWMKPSISMASCQLLGVSTTFPL